MKESGVVMATARAGLVDYGEARADIRGWRRFQRAVVLADPGAESPQESRLRVRLVLAGIPNPVTQYVIERVGEFVRELILPGRIVGWPSSMTASGTLRTMSTSIMIVNGSTGLSPPESGWSCT